MEFIITAPAFNQNSGGSIVLYKLCHILNQIGLKSSIYPLIPNINPVQHSIEKYLEYFIDQINPSFNTPICNLSIEDISKKDDIITIYPEIISGNPIKGKNIVRWLLHHPGFMTGTVLYGTNEYFIRYHNWVKKIDIIDSKMSEKILYITHFPFEIYNEYNQSNNRSGTAYCIRKGVGRQIIHNTENSILIDGKTHEEIAKIFKSAKQFISYDTETAYINFAALCGCESIVIPREGVSIDEWRPSIEDRYGIAYGFENIDFANKTKNLIRNQMQKKESENIESVIFFVEEVMEYFIEKIKNRIEK